MHQNDELMWAKYKEIRGFTIVELLIVIVVIAILAAIVIVSYNGVTQNARDSSRSAAVDTIKEGLELYRYKNNMYPSVCSGGDGSSCSASELQSALNEYIGEVPQDPQYPTKWISYVRGPVAQNSYALRVLYEAKPQCKTGVNVNMTWWGSAPLC